MVDCGEKVSATVKREFLEEAMNSTERNEEEKEKIIKQLENLFKQEVIVSHFYETYIPPQLITFKIFIF